MGAVDDVPVEGSPAEAGTEEVLTREALERELAELRARVEAQEQPAAEAPRPGTSRRGLLGAAAGIAGAAAVAGAVGSVVSAAGAPETAEAAPISDAARIGMRAYLTLTIAGQVVQGEVTQKGREGTIEVLGWYQRGFRNFKATAPAYANARRYEPIRFRKLIDKSTPLILKGFVEGSAVDAEFKFWRPTAVGSEQQHYTVKGANGFVVSVEQASPDGLGSTSTASTSILEDVELVFRSLSWTYNPTSTTAEDKVNIA